MNSETENATAEQSVVNSETKNATAETAEQSVVNSETEETTFLESLKQNQDVSEAHTGCEFRDRKCNCRTERCEFRDRRDDFSG